MTESSTSAPQRLFQSELQFTSPDSHDLSCCTLHSHFAELPVAKGKGRLEMQLLLHWSGEAETHILPKITLLNCTTAKARGHLEERRKVSKDKS